MGWLQRLLGGSKRDQTTASVTPPPRSVLAREDPGRDDPYPGLIEPIERLYPGQLPFHYGVNVRFADGGPDPLSGISIFWSATGPHWHYVSWGMREWGFELTFRLAARPDEIGTEPASFLGSIAYQAPTWPIAMLNMLARRVHRTGRRFGHGHWWQGPPGSRPEYLVFARDPELGVVETPIGPITFLQAMAATAPSIDANKRDEEEGRGDAELERLLQSNPLLVSDRSLGNE